MIERRMQLSLRSRINEYLANGYTLQRIYPLTLRRGRAVIEIRNGVLVKGLCA